MCFTWITLRGQKRERERDIPLDVGLHPSCPESEIRRLRRRIACLLGFSPGHLQAHAEVAQPLFGHLEMKEFFVSQKEPNNSHQRSSRGSNGMVSELIYSPTIRS